jgi:hypothetical protein
MIYVALLLNSLVQWITLTERIICGKFLKLQRLASLAKKHSNPDRDLLSPALLSAADARKTCDKVFKRRYKISIPLGVSRFHFNYLFYSRGRLTGEITKNNKS